LPGYKAFLRGEAASQGMLGDSPRLREGDCGVRAARPSSESSRSLLATTMGVSRCSGRWRSAWTNSTPSISGIRSWATPPNPTSPMAWATRCAARPSAGSAWPPS